MSQPLVSIALPIYNSGRFLERAVMAIRRQTFTDFEVVAVLDGCTDDSAGVLDRCKDERFLIINKRDNQGHTAALNDIHRIACGRFLARFDSDDDYEPDRLLRQIKFFETHPDVHVVGTQFDYIDEREQVVRTSNRFPLSHERIRRDFQRYTVIGGPTCMYRLEAARGVGNYDPEFNHVEDLALWLALLAAGCRFANLPDVLVHYRVHDTQASQRNHERQIPQLRVLYARYGPLIWGANARPYGAREPRLSRWKRKLHDALLPEAK